MSRSLLLHSLEPKPDRKALEEITADIASIARADAAGILWGWFGIVSSGLPIEEAQAFQAGLRTLGCETDIVPDGDIPSLHHDFRCQRIDLDASSITLTTAMNRRQVRNRGELVFAAAGFLDRERMVTNSELQIEKDTVMFYGDRPLRMKNRTELTLLMADLKSLLPPDRMNRGLRELSTETLYPSLQTYEEEIRWAFYRLGAKG
jgi:hypothetical protein